MIMNRLKKQSGFTLIEMIIVVIILGILAMIIIPQISVSTGDAKLSTLQTNLSTVRSSLELYYHQHNETYPGDMAAAGGATPDDETAFANQLTRYTNTDGEVSETVGDPLFPFGPYIKNGKLPSNPFSGTNTVSIDSAETDITVRAASGGNEGWKFYRKTGVFIADDLDGHTDE